MIDDLHFIFKSIVDHFQSLATFPFPFKILFRFPDRKVYFLFKKKTAKTKQLDYIG